jgi:pimeloyl-ACP methyl ester carboxylesterase
MSSAWALTVCGVGGEDVPGQRVVLIQREQQRREPGNLVRLRAAKGASEKKTLTRSLDTGAVTPRVPADQENAQAKRLVQPVLAVGAEFVFGPGVGASFQQVVNDVRAVVAPGAGHWPQEETPQFVQRGLPVSIPTRRPIGTPWR